MSRRPDIRIEFGFPEHHREEVADLFWGAFSDKLGRVMAPERKAKAFIRKALRPDHAISAQTEEGALLGVAGYKTARGGLLQAGFRELADGYSFFGALWRGPLLDLMERPLKDGQLLMDGIFVSERARGTGVGTALIGAVVHEAQKQGMAEVRLDVIDTNPRARALYERVGFIATAEMDLGFFAPIFGFRHATTMCLPLDPVAG